MKIYTKTGDKGLTSLVDGTRVPKYHQRLEAYGTVDELNTVLGVAVSRIDTPEISSLLRRVQNELFRVGSMLATPYENKEFKPPFESFEDLYFKKLESEIDEFEKPLAPLSSFIIPGGSKGAALLHHARTVCRRAERRVVEISEILEIDNNIVIYLNRLSDLLFVLARYENHKKGIADEKWQK